MWLFMCRPAPTKEGRCQASSDIITNPAFEVRPQSLREFQAWLVQQGLARAPACSLHLWAHKHRFMCAYMCECYLQRSALNHYFDSSNHADAIKSLALALHPAASYWNTVRVCITCWLTLWAGHMKVRQQSNPTCAGVEGIGADDSSVAFYEHTSSGMRGAVALKVCGWKSGLCKCRSCKCRHSHCLSTALIQSILRCTMATPAAQTCSINPGSCMTSLHAP